MKLFTKILIGLIILFVGLAIGILIGFKLYYSDGSFISPLVGVNKQTNKILPLEKYQIDKLSDFSIVESKVEIEEKINSFDQYDSYLFSYEATGGKVTGQLNIPQGFNNQNKIIVLARGYVNKEVYQTGVGTKSAAGVFAQNGYVTLAPDFLGYGGSDPEPDDSWETRFIKQVNFYELIKAVEKSDLEYEYCNFISESTKIDPANCEEESTSYQIGLWGHSNGGQVVLTTLEGFGLSLPTTLWAPVTAPFPYSVLYFSDENDDEGKAARAWIAIFERDYDAYQYSISKNLNLLDGNIIIHHGTADTSALHDWSQEFVEKVKLENEKREEYNQNIDQASHAAQIREKDLINIELITYPGADHNMRPVWNSVIKKDLEFFAEQFN